MEEKLDTSKRVFKLGEFVRLRGEKNERSTSYYIKAIIEEEDEDTKYKLCNTQDYDMVRYISHHELIERLVEETPVVEDDDIRVVYLCDRKQCENCSYPTCKYTTNIAHAKNFIKFNSSVEYYEVEPNGIDTDGDSGCCPIDDSHPDSYSVPGAHFKVGDIVKFKDDDLWYSVHVVDPFIGQYMIGHVNELGQDMTMWVWEEEIELVCDKNDISIATVTNEPKFKVGDPVIHTDFVEVCVVTGIHTIPIEGTNTCVYEYDLDMLHGGSSYFYPVAENHLVRFTPDSYSELFMGRLKAQLMEDLERLQKQIANSPFFKEVK